MCCAALVEHLYWHSMTNSRSTSIENNDCDLSNIPPTNLDEKHKEMVELNKEKTMEQTLHFEF